jgi:hypothetical protein
MSEKKVVAGLIEGSGKLECTDASHEDPFITYDLAEFEEHLKSGSHVKHGFEPCAICEKEVKMEGHPYGKKPVCDECKADIISG